ncbi:MAG: hypothetical protein V2B20_07280 [Pseudomonadota bacterium]
MRKIVLLIVLLTTVVAAHAEEPARNTPALSKPLQEVERQLVQSGVPENDAQETVRAMVQAHFSVAQMAQVGKQLVSENRWGIEGQAVRNKIHEGIAKGIPPETILSATARVQNRFEYSRKLAAVLDEAENVSIVAMYADCLAAGLTEQHARQLANALKARSARPGESAIRNLKEETLVTARDMVRRTISSATTTEVLERALAHGYAAEGMRALRKSLAGSSGDVENTAKRFGAAIDQGVRAGDLQGFGKSGVGTGDGSEKGGGQGASGGSSGGSGGGGGSGRSGGGGGSSGGSGGGGKGGGGGGGGRS